MTFHIRFNMDKTNHLLGYLEEITNLSSNFIQIVETRQRTLEYNIVDSKEAVGGSNEN